MLILSRHAEEVIDITTPDGTTITIMVISIDHGRVRLGFTAPSEVKINRREVTQRIAAGGATP